MTKTNKPYIMTIASIIVFAISILYMSKALIDKAYIYAIPDALCCACMLAVFIHNLKELITRNI